MAPRRRDGLVEDVFFFDVACQPLLDASGAVSALLVHAVDVTDRHGRADALQQAQLRQAAYLEQAIDGVIVMDAEGRVEEFNPAAERMFGYARADVIGREMAALIVPPRLREAHRRGLSRALQTGEGRVLGQRLELPAIRADGTEFPVELSIARVGQQHPALFIGCVRDVSDRRAAERALLDRARLASLGADVGLALTRSATLDEMLQQSAQAVVDRLGAAFARVWTLNKTDQVLELQASAGLYTHRDGPHGRVPVGRFKIGQIAAERRPHLTNAVIGDPRVNDQDWATREGMVAFAGYPLLVGGDVEGVLAMFARRALGEYEHEGLATVAQALALGIARQRTVQAVADGEARYRFLADAIPVQVWTATPGGQLDYVNQQMVAYVGRSAATLVGSHWENLVQPEDRALAAERWCHSLRTGTPFSIHVRLPNAEGASRWHIGRAMPFRDAAGRLTRWFGTHVDVENEKQTQLALAERADELANLAAALERSNRELDQFAYVASHDLKAPLRGIANLSQWIEEDLGDGMPEATREHMALLRGRVHRMEALIDGILEYSRVGRVRNTVERIDVGHLVTEAIELLSTPHVRFEVDPALPVILSERLPLQQVLLNLLGNAVKHGAAEQPVVRVGARPSEGGFEIWVADNGPGIDPAYHDRIWAIFQTLEARDRVEGTGIGLALVKKIVELRGGRAWVESAPGCGATFKVLWRAAPAVAP